MLSLRNERNCWGLYILTATRSALARTPPLQQYSVASLPLLTGYSTSSMSSSSINGSIAAETVSKCTCGYSSRTAACWCRAVDDGQRYGIRACPRREEHPARWATERCARDE